MRIIVLLFVFFSGVLLGQNASAYPPGIYFVTVRSGDDERTAKVIIR